MPEETPPLKLNPGTLQILQLVADGSRLIDAYTAIGISKSSGDQRLKAIREKLKAKTIYHLIAEAVRKELID